MDLFEGAEDEDAIDIREHLTTRFESASRTLEAMFEGVKKSEHVIEEIRNLTETDGVVQEPVDLQAIVKKSIEKSHKVVQVH